MKLAVLTSRSARHHWFAREISREHTICAWVQEGKRDLVAEARASDEPPDLMQAHIAELVRVQAEMFGESIDPPDAPLLDVPNGRSNSAEVFDFLQAHDPDAVLLFGTSIIKPPILSTYEGRILNMHLGLSPYYRGSATNFWPLVHGEPECVGTTIHHAILAVDAGAILAQARPAIAAGDGPHEIGCKAIIAGTQAFLEVLRRVETEGFRPGQVQASGEGRVFRRRDFSSAAVATLREKFAAGLVPAYLENKSRRDAAYPIVEFPTP